MRWPTSSTHRLVELDLARQRLGLLTDLVRQRRFGGLFNSLDELVAADRATAVGIVVVEQNSTVGPGEAWNAEIFEECESEFTEFYWRWWRWWRW